MNISCHIAFYISEQSQIQQWYALLYKKTNGNPEYMVPLLSSFSEYFKKTERPSYRPPYGAKRKEERDFFLNERLVTRFFSCTIVKQFQKESDYIYLVFPHKITVMKVAGIVDTEHPKGRIVQEVPF